MKLKRLIIMGAAVFFCCACATKAPIVLNTPERLYLSETNLTAGYPEIYPFGETSLLDFYQPELEITDTFSLWEKRHITVPDEKLFTKGYEVVLNVDQFVDEDFVFPLTHARVVSNYGKRRGRPHTGIDLQTLPNDTVRAAFSGIVRVSSRASGYGNVVVIRHYNGLETLYAHNSKHFVKSGDRVEAGTPIAISGRTGRAYGDHVHFETRFNGQHFDPNMLIDFETYTLKPRCIVFRKSEKGNILIRPII